MRNVIYLSAEKTPFPFKQMLMLLDIKNWQERNVNVETFFEISPIHFPLNNLFAFTSFHSEEEKASQSSHTSTLY